MKQHPWTRQTVVDDPLKEKTSLDSWTIARLRKAFRQEYDGLNLTQRAALAEGTDADRLSLMVAVMRDRVLNDEQWSSWLRYCGDEPGDVEEMCQGAFTISPFLVRMYSAVFGIKVQYLLLGDRPELNIDGRDVAVWPLTTAIAR